MRGQESSAEHVRRLRAIWDERVRRAGQMREV